MKRTGVTVLPLHAGGVPRWLIARMVRLAGEVTTILITEYGRDEFLRRISDPFWFQALGCALGFDWHSSGLTTVLTAVLKCAVKPEEHGLAVCGGKGKTSLRTPKEIEEVGEVFGLSTSRIGELKYASRMSCKVDNAAVQAGYPLYHHAFFVTEDGRWAVVQQGMCVWDRTARRYHWLSENVQNFVLEPHNAIVGDAVREVALDMTARESLGCQKVSVDLARERPSRVMRMLRSIRPAHQRSLQEWIPKLKREDYVVEVLSLPLNVNWDALRRAYELQPRNYEELLSIRGVGPATVRALALISELIYGERPSWKDPVKFSFCVGGKDGVPYPVDRATYDQLIEILENAIKQARIGNEERLHAIRRLRRLMSR